MSPADHFSAQAADYARFRPCYPDALFDWLAAASARRARAWDCGTGSGQAATALATRFAQVVATDLSVAQLRHAARAPRVAYAAATAEAPPLAAGCVDLVTVAQAYHWFDAERFAAAARRVATDEALVAAWSYGRCVIDPRVDAAVEQLYEGVLGAYWPAERRLVEDGYRAIAFPFAELPAPAFALSARWPLAGFLGYLRSWSAARRFADATGRDAIAEATPSIGAVWGDGVRAISWPIALRVGRIHR